MDEPSLSTDPDASSGRGVLGFAVVLLLVLVVIVLGSRQELAQTLGLSGEAGTFTASGCGRDLQYDGTPARAQCVGEFRPDGGGEAFAAQLFHDGDAGESYDARADRDSGDAHRTGWSARWAALALPATPIPILWMTLGWWWAMRRPGALTGPQRGVVVGVFAVPAGLLLLACAVGFVISLVTS